jgi:hypothetical protein
MEELRNPIRRTQNSLSEFRGVRSLSASPVMTAGFSKERRTRLQRRRLFRIAAHPSPRMELLEGGVLKTLEMIVGRREIRNGDVKVKRF